MQPLIAHYAEQCTTILLKSVLLLSLTYTELSFTNMKGRILQLPVSTKFPSIHVYVLTLLLFQFCLC